MTFGGFRLQTLNFSAFGRGLSLRLHPNGKPCLGCGLRFPRLRVGTFIEAPQLRGSNDLHLYFSTLGGDLH